MMEQNTQQSDQLASEFFDSNTVDDNSDTDLREQQEQYELYHTARHLPKDVAMAVGFSKTSILFNIFSRLSARLIDFSRLKLFSFSITAS